MSLINQVLKNIEQRQAGSPLERTELKAQLHPVLAMQDDEWRFPTWLKLFFLGFLIGALLYISGHRLMHMVKQDAPATSVVPASTLRDKPRLADNDLQMYSQLTRTLSTQWQAQKNESKSSSSTPAQLSEKKSSAPTQALPKLMLSQAQHLKLSHIISNHVAETSTENIEDVTNEKLSSAPEPNQALALPSEYSATSKPASGFNLVKPADPNFTSAVTPTSPPEPVQVVKQMKPEQEANQHLQRAMDMYQKGRVAEAIDATKKALSLAPQSEEARLLLATYLTENKQSPEAIQVLQSGVQLQPKQPGLRKALAKLQFAEGQPEKALQTLQQGADIAQRDADYAAYWALTLQKVNKHRNALPLFELALRANPSQVQWLVGYAISLQADGQTQEALKQFQEAQNLPASERLSAFIQQRIQQLQTQ